MVPSIRRTFYDKLSVTVSLGISDGAHVNGTSSECGQGMAGAEPETHFRIPLCDCDAMRN